MKDYENIIIHLCWASVFITFIICCTHLVNEGHRINTEYNYKEHALHIRDSLIDNANTISYDENYGEYYEEE